MRWTVAADFDGVIHSYTSKWEAADVIPDPPVPGAIDWLNEIVADYDVAIYTTRGATLKGERAVKYWLETWGCEWAWEAVVTDKKPPALIYLDDRAWRFAGTFPTAEQVKAFQPWKVDQAKPSGLNAVHEAVALTLAGGAPLAVSRSIDADGVIPQEVWDALHDRGYVVTATTHPGGDSETWTTQAGLLRLGEILDTA